MRPREFNCWIFIKVLILFPASILRNSHHWQQGFLSFFLFRFSYFSTVFNFFRFSSLPIFSFSFTSNLILQFLLYVRPHYHFNHLFIKIYTFQFDSTDRIKSYLQLVSFTHFEEKMPKISPNYLISFLIMSTPSEDIKWRYFFHINLSSIYLRQETFFDRHFFIE